MGRGVKKNHSAGSPPAVRGQGIVHAVQGSKAKVQRKIHSAIDSLEDSLGVERTTSGTVMERASGLVKKKFLNTPLGSFIKRKYDSQESLSSFVAFSAPALAAPLAVSQTLSQVPAPVYAMVIAGAAVGFFLWRQEKSYKDYQIKKADRKASLHEDYDS